MHQLARGRAAIEGPGITFFDDYDAGALDSLIVGIHCRGDEIGEAHVGDEAAALLQLQHGSCPSSHFATRSLPPRMPVSTPT